MTLRMQTGDKRIVAVLLLVLVGAVAVTVVRMKCLVNAPPESPAVAMAAGRSAKSADVVVSPVRNPFLKPERLRSVSQKDEVQGGFPLMCPTGPKPMPLTPIEGLTIGPPTVTEGPSQPVKVEAPVAPAPKSVKYTLLATVQSADRLCGVIKPGDAQPRIVSVGDTLDGGFVVKMLSPSQAVLSDGRNVIIAEKPESQAQSRS